MKKKGNALSLIVISILIINVIATDGVARALYDMNGTQGNPQIFEKPLEGLPNKQYALHNIGRMGLLITNYGTFGSGFVSSPICDGQTCPSCEFPIHSGLEYLFAGALWIGAISGRDTLVSTGAEGWYANLTELNPDEGANGAIMFRSNIRTKPEYSSKAISEQDFVSNYTDTFKTPNNTGTDAFDNRNHIPLNVAVRQSSYAWSYDYAQDFVIFDFLITNIGQFPIKDMYMGVYVDADVYHRSVGSNGAQDDICGFRRAVSAPKDLCIPDDSVMIAWIADNDGDPVSDAWAFSSTRAVTGTRVLRTPNKDLKYSFNWWVSNNDASLDFGPRLAGTPTDPFRSFGAWKGTPTGDKNKYYVLRHPEFDYDQIFTAVSHTAEGWEAPPRATQATDIANGFDTRYLLSFGPFNVQPGDSLPITAAYVAGDNFHVNPTDFTDFDPANPAAFYDKLNFGPFGDNARWADWIFDNPGYDTDGNGDSGYYVYRVQTDAGFSCYKGDNPARTRNDTVLAPLPDSLRSKAVKVYYKGDGVPDFRGASPPPPPEVKVLTSFGKVILRWNGQITENSVDVFSALKDFEGYRVYYSEGSRATDYVQVASYDLDDYKVFRYSSVSRSWDQVSAPMTRDSLKKLYGQDLEPLNYFDESHYFAFQGTDGTIQIYFARQDWNQSDLSNPLGIHKVYPRASKDDKADTTNEGFMRYYEYEYEIPNLEPSKPYYFSVTAFDFGSLKKDLGVMESSPLVNAVRDYPLPSSDAVEAEGLGVIVYPNPYRIDGGYAKAGYENRDRIKSAERSRAVNFANLPKVCTIRIYTVAGDLVKEIVHNEPNGGPMSQHETWNVISRNTQAVVTGIYLWHVQSDMGEQIGKLVIIK